MVEVIKPVKPGPQVEFFGGPLDGNKTRSPGLQYRFESDTIAHKYSLQVFVRGEKRFPGLVYVGEEVV